MSELQLVSKEQIGEILAPLVDRRTHLLVTYHGLCGWRSYKSQFAAVSAASRTLIVHCQVPEDGPASAVPNSDDVLGFSFRVGHKKCMFAARVKTVQQRDNGYLLTIRWPDRINQLQRRLCERVPLPPNLVIPVRVWALQEPLDPEPEERTVRNGQLVDLSVGGLSLRMASAAELQLGGTYRCVFTPQKGEPALIVDGTLKHREAAEQGRARIGVQFVGLESVGDGRHTLDALVRTVSQFQRHSKGRQKG